MNIYFEKHNDKWPFVDFLFIIWLPELFLFELDFVLDRFPNSTKSELESNQKYDIAILLNILCFDYSLLCVIFHPHSVIFFFVNYLYYYILCYI